MSNSDHLPVSEKPTQISALILCTNADRAGAPIHVKELAQGLKQSGVLATLAFGEHGPIERALKADGFEVHVIHEMRSAISPIRDLKALKSVVGLMRKINPDLVHCHSSKAGMLGRMAAWLHSKPVIFTIHGWGFGPGRKQSISKFVFLTERFLKPLTNFYISVSLADEHAGIKTLGISHQRIKTIRNGVSDGGERTKLQGDRVITMVARNDFPKDYQTLASALKYVEFVKALFVGDRTDDLEFCEQCRGLAAQNADKLHFLGPRDDVPSLLARSQVFVLSSRFEGLPLSIIEAMRQGLPIVASRVGGVPELVADGINGLMFEPGDSTALAQSLSTILSDDNLRLRMGEESRRRFLTEFSKERMIEETVKVYKQVLNLQF